MTTEPASTSEDLSSGVFARNDVGFQPGVAPAALPSGVEPEAAGPKDLFLELTGTLPGTLPANRLRILIRDPGTLYVYWTTDDWQAHSYRISCRLDPASATGGTEPSWSQDIPATSRECWLQIPAGARGTVSLEVLENAQGRTVGRAYFHAPIGKSRPISPQGEWRVPVANEGPSEAPAAHAASPAVAWDGAAASPGHEATALQTTTAAPPEGIGPADVQLEERVYHGHAWRRPN